MRLEEAAVRSFARHETFHPRYGWFRKAYAVSASDPLAFGRPEAPVVLGVGKNMVRAIRFWGLAAKIVTEAPNASNRRVPRIVPTVRGRALFGKHGWDPYMEDPGTLWLLHWLLLAPPSRLPVWWLAFNSFDAVEFSESDLREAAAAQLQAAAGWGAPHESSVTKDVSALMRTYAPVEPSRRMSIDDVLDCPMRELKLLERSAATGLPRFTLGPKPTLPSAIATHAVFDYIDRITGNRGDRDRDRSNSSSRNRGGRRRSGKRLGGTMLLSRLATEPGTPGRAFKLNESELLSVLEPAAAEHDEFRLETSNGVWQLAYSVDAAEIATGVLDVHYGTASAGVCSGRAGDEPISERLFDQPRHGPEPRADSPPNTARNPSPALAAVP